MMRQAIACSLIDANGVETRYGYDALSRLI